MGTETSMHDDVGPFGDMFVLGASDPEMEAIEQLLREKGKRWRPASINYARVTASQAYTADPVDGTHYVECSPKSGRSAGAVVIDHHRPGDPGFGGAPADFLKSSSIGQVLAILGVEPRPEHLLIAAADHCPGAGYAGLCPGVNPEELMAHRAKASAAFQKKTVEAVLAEVVAATAAIQAAPRIVLGDKEVADLRPGTVPGLPEACLRLGTPVIYQMTEKDGRQKVGILGAGEGTPAGTAPVADFIGSWGPNAGLTGLYGDPVRGFAGGYKSGAA